MSGMRFVFCSYCSEWTWVYPETVMRCPHCGRDVTCRDKDGEVTPDTEVAPIVRCKDCKYYSGANDKDGYFTAIGFCNHESHHIMPLRYDFYCADAKKI